MLAKVFKIANLVKENPYLVKAFVYSCLQHGPAVAFQKVIGKSEGYRQSFEGYRFISPSPTAHLPDGTLPVLNFSEGQNGKVALRYANLVGSEFADQAFADSIVNADLTGAFKKVLETLTTQYLLITLGCDPNISEINAISDRLIRLRKKPPAAVYFDSQAEKLDGKIVPFFRPEFSPEHLLAIDFYGSVIAFNLDDLKKIGDLGEVLSGRELVTKLLFKLSETKKDILHIPEILYSEPDYLEIRNSEEIGKRSLQIRQDYLNRLGFPAIVRQHEIFPSVFDMIPKLKAQPKVSIVIPFKDGGLLLEKCLQSVYEKSTYANIEVIAIDNNSVELATSQLIERYLARPNFKFFKYNKPFNYAAINNFAVSKAQGEYVVLVNSDIEILSPDWLESLLSYAQQSDIGAVGGLLFYADHSIQHAGIVMGVGEVAGHSHKNLPFGQTGYFYRPYCAQEVSAVTAACLMVRTKSYQEVGGLDEVYLGVLYNDVDFCLKLRRQGYRNIFSPHCQAIHHESKTRGHDFSAQKIERNRRETHTMLSRYKDLLDNGDPFYSPHLTRDREDFSLNRGSIYCAR